MTFSTYLSRLRLTYPDPQQEKEYFRIKLPLLKSFFSFLLICLIILAVPLAARFFYVHLSTQGFMAVGMLILAIILFITRNLFGKWIEYVILLYLIAMVLLIIINLSQVLLSFKSCESFYCGYAFAMLHRLLGYRVFKVHSMILFHGISLTFRLIFLYDHQISISLMVSAVELATICLCIKSEKGERSLFNSLYQAKKQSEKFKDFLTEHLPNQMAIFAKDFSRAFFMNKAFEKSFQCDNISQVKKVFKSLVVEKDAIEKNSSFFASIGYDLSSNHPLKLSRLLRLLSKSQNLTSDLESLTFQVCEHETGSEELETLSDKSDADSLREDGVLNKMTVSQAGGLKSLNTESAIVTPVNGRVFNFNKRRDSEAFFIAPMAFGGLDRKEATLSIQEEIREKNNIKEKGEKEVNRRVFKVKIVLLPWDGNDAMAVVLDDITQQRTIMELKVADKNKDLVIAMISHELRTPLNGMLGIIDIVKRMVGEEDHTVPYLNVCKNSGVFLLNLVNSILDMSQIKNNKLKLVYTRVSIEELLCEIKSLFEPLCSPKNLYLDIKSSENVPKTIVTDKNRLSQILINLLGNAFKFTFEGGVTVRVSLENKIPARVRFEIQDTGLGIKKEEQEKLFKLFGRLEQQDRKINTNGVGLGLTISNTLAALLNSTEKRGVHVESESGKGSTFSFTVECKGGDISEDKSSAEETSIHELYVPFSANQQHFVPLSAKLSSYATTSVLNFDKMRNKRRSETTRLHSPTRTEMEELMVRNESGPQLNKSAAQVLNLKNTTRFRTEGSFKLKGFKYNSDNEEQEDKPYCLIVDDNPFNIIVAAHIMEEKGYRIIKALNGEEAIQEMKKHHENGKVFKLVLMDCQMPVMDGFEATRILKEMMKRKEIGDCPIVALTANNRDEDHEKLCEEVGMAGSLAKPLQTEELTRIMQRLYRKKTMLSL